MFSSASSCSSSFFLSMWFSDGGLSPKCFYSCVPWMSSFLIIFLSMFLLHSVISPEKHIVQKKRTSVIKPDLFLLILLVFIGPELHISWTWIPERYCCRALTFFILVLCLWVREVQHGVSGVKAPKRMPVNHCDICFFCVCTIAGFVCNTLTLVSDV